MWKVAIISVAAVLIALILGGVYLVSSGAGDAFLANLDPSRKPAIVRVEEAKAGDLVRTISAPGVIEPRTKVEISAQVAARIVSLPFREGQRVKKGDVVITLDSIEYQAAVESARALEKSERARVEGARAQYANASLEAGRKRELFDSKDIAKSELDQAVAALAQAEANLKAAELAIDIARANVAKAEKDLANTIIAAPFDGTITKLNAEVGELVLVGTLNNPASVIMEIADLSDMLMKAKIDEANIAPVKAPQASKVYINAFPDRTFSATVERVRMLREIDRDGNAYFETELKLDNPEQTSLYSGMTANADIEVETVRGVLLVPSQAVLDRLVDDLPSETIEAGPPLDKSKKFARVVYQIKEGKAVARLVHAGASDLTHTVILAGLNPGEKIVTGPFKVLQDLKQGKSLQEGDPNAKENKPKK